MSVDRTMVRIGAAGALLLSTPTSAHAQHGTDTPCESGKGYYRDCALEAGGIRDLREGSGYRVVREIRFTIDGGIGVPHHLLILREYQDSVVGQSVLIWPRRFEYDSFAIARCDRMWINPSAMLCDAKLARQVDWNGLLHRLDRAGVTTIPQHPVAEKPCGPAKPPRPTPPPMLGRDNLPIDQLDCIVVNDGPSLSMEYRGNTLYWWYAFPIFPPLRGKGVAEVQAVSDLVHCAMRLRADTPLKKCGQ